MSIFDHGFLYGDGVFEGIRAYNGRVFRLMEHVDRLFDSAKAIDLIPPVTKEEMAEIIKETLRQNNLKNAYIRPIISRGVGSMGLDPHRCEKPTVICAAFEWDAMYGDLYEKGLTAVTVCVHRNTPDSLPLRAFLENGAHPLSDLTNGVGGTFHAYGTREHPEQIDYILGSAGTAFRDAHRLTGRKNGMFLSDHDPVAVTVTAFPGALN